MGIKSFNRYATIMLGLIIFSLFVMILGAYPKAELSNFAPNADFKEITESVIREFCSSGELVMMFVLLEFVPEPDVYKRQASAFTFSADNLNSSM